MLFRINSAKPLCFHTVLLVAIANLAIKLKTLIKRTDTRIRPRRGRVATISSTGGEALVLARDRTMKDRDPIEKTHKAGHSHHERVHSKKRHRAGSPQSDEVFSGPQVIARIPRLPRNGDYVVPKKPSRGQPSWLAGRRPAMWVVMGGIGFLVVAALFVPKAFQSKNTELATQDSAFRPEVPAPDAPPAPRWAGGSSSAETWQAANSATTTAPDSGPRGGPLAEFRSPVSPAGSVEGAFVAPSPVAAHPVEPSYSAGYPGDRSVARGGLSEPVPAYSSPSVPSAANVPWQPVPGARRPDIVVDGPGANGPITQNRPPIASYAGPSRGGLINGSPMASRDAYGAAPPSPRDNYPVDPRSDYRTAARQRYAPEPTSGQDYSYPPARAGEAARDGWSPDDRNDGAMSGYPNRGRTVGYETSSPVGGQPAAGHGPAAAGNPGSPDWVSPPTWATPPAWNSSQSAPAAGASAPSYPTTSYTAGDSWPNAGPAAPGAVAPTEYQAARFEGTIERPTARNSYERTGSSIR